MKLRTLALALALSCGFTSTAAFAAGKKYSMPKAKKIKPKKDPRFKDSKAAKVKPRKVPKVKARRA